RIGILCSLLCSSSAFAVLDWYLVVTVNLTQLTYSPYTMTSAGSALYYDYWGTQRSADLSGTHAIRGDDNSTPAMETVSGSNGQWAGTMGGISGAAGVFYRARVDASGGGASQGLGSNQACYQPLPPIPPPPGSGGTPTGTGDDTFNASGAGSDPIVIPLPGQYTLSGLNDPVAFDINAIGRPQTIGWTSRAADVAFLALDRN